MALWPCSYVAMLLYGYVAMWLKSPKMPKSKNGFLVSWLQGFKVAKFQTSNVLKFQRSKGSDIINLYCFQIVATVSLEIYKVIN